MLCKQLFWIIQGPMTQKICLLVTSSFDCLLLNKEQVYVFRTNGIFFQKFPLSFILWKIDSTDAELAIKN